MKIYDFKAMRVININDYSPKNGEELCTSVFTIILPLEYESYIIV